MIALLATAAFGQVSPDDVPAVDIQFFRPSSSAQHTLWTHDATVLPNKYWAAGLTTHYAKDPLVWVGEDGTPTAVVDGVITSSVTGGIQFGKFWFGADVPIVLRSTGLFGGETGLGDALVEVKGIVLDHEDKPVGLALAGHALLPTSSLSAPLGGGGFGYEFEAILDRPVGEGLFAVNLGYHGNPDRELASSAFGDRLFGRLGLGMPVSDALTLSGELTAAFNTGKLVKGANLPAEALAGVAYRVVPNVELRGGVGTGLTGAVGTPIFRGLLGLHYAPVLESDRDEDGVLDRVDQCRSVPEDRDGVEDADGCPEPTLVTIRVEDQAGNIIGPATWTLTGDEGAEGRAGDTIERFAGAYHLTAAAEGYAPNETRDKIKDGPPQNLVVTLEKIILPGRVTVTVSDDEDATVAGARWWMVGDEGTPRDAGESLELAPGSHEVRIEAVGFRPQTVAFELAEAGEQAVAVRLQTARVVLTGDQIEIKDSVYFETGKATIKEESFTLLGEVAQILIDHPELTRIRIEGHTDSRGSAFANKELSQARANSVSAFLTEVGVAAERLDPIGFGEGRPLEKGTGEEVWSRNRRVDFFIVARDEP